jgi:hypothetical protein
MPNTSAHVCSSSRSRLEATARDVLASLAAGEPPKEAIARLNAEIVAAQQTGGELPGCLLRLTQSLTAGDGQHVRRLS